MDVDHAYIHSGVSRERTPATIARCVRDSLQVYLDDLDGHEAGGIFQMIICEVERPLLEVVMNHAGGNITRAAQILGINRVTLRKKLKKYDLIP